MKKIWEILINIKDRTWITNDDYLMLKDRTNKLLYNRNFNKNNIGWFSEDVLTEALVRVNRDNFKGWVSSIKKYFIYELTSVAYELSFMFDYPVDIPKWVLKFLESSYTWDIDYPIAWEAIKALQRSEPLFSLLEWVLSDRWEWIKNLNIKLLLENLVPNNQDNKIVTDYILADKTFNDIGNDLWLSKENVRQKYYKILDVLKSKLKDSQNI